MGDQRPWRNVVQEIYNRGRLAWRVNTWPQTPIIEPYHSSAETSYASNVSSPSTSPLIPSILSYDDENNIERTESKASLTPTASACSTNNPDTQPTQPSTPYNTPQETASENKDAPQQPTRIQRANAVLGIRPRGDHPRASTPPLPNRQNSDNNGRGII